MGIYDRGYYHDDEWRGQPSGRGVSGRSMVTTLILINVGVFVLDLFSPVVPLVPRPTQNELNQFTAEQRRRVEELIREDKNQWVSVTLALKTNALQNDPQKGQLPEQVGVGPLEKPWMFWQLLTYGFAHASLGTSTGMMHIAFNMLTLFFLGRAVEQRYGSQEFIRIYLVAIVIAGLAWLLAHAIRRDPGWAVGASGAVATVVILFVLNFPKQTVLLMGVLPMPAWVLGVLFIGIDILNSFSAENQIAVEAHFAGAAFAVAYFYGKWHFRWLKFGWLTDRFSGKPRLRVHSPDKGNEKLSEQADRILDKLHREGEQSLSKRERKILEEYSRRMRDRRDPEA